MAQTTSGLGSTRNGIKTCDLSQVFATSGADGMELYALPTWHPVRWIFIKRALLLIDLFQRIPRPESLMEMGFGCGILVPELVSKTDRYVGIDIHSHTGEIEEALSQQIGLVDLRYGDANNLEFDDNSLDCIFSMSVMEHIAEIEGAVENVARVLKPGGHFIVGFPIENFVSNAFLDMIKLMIGFDRKVHHPTNHHQILAALGLHLEPFHERPFPFSGSVAFSLYYTGIWRKPEN